MKQNDMRILIKTALVGLSVLGLAMGCAKTAPDVETGSVDGMILSAGITEPETKTALGTPENGAYPIVWKEGDRISVNGTYSDTVPAAKDGEENVDFTVNGTLTAPYKVLYPGTTSANVIALPDTQHYEVNSFDADAAACYGNAVKRNNNIYSVSLTHFCGVIRFALKGSATIDRIELNSLGDEKLYGNFTLATDSNGFTGAFSGGAAGTLTYACGSGVTLNNNDKYFFISIPAQTYTAGIEALVYQADGAFMRLKFWGTGYTLAGNALVEFQSKTFAAGRTENLVAISDLTAEDGGEPTSERPGITVGVYNIKMAENRTGTNSTYINMDRSDVQAGLGSTIVGMGADIFGINEVGEDNMPGETHDIKAWAIAQGLSSSDYTWKMDYPNKVSRSGVVGFYSYSTEMYYANVFAYNKNTIAVEDDGYVWICNDEDDYYSTKSGAYGHGRHTAVYAKCRHKVSGYRFWFIVTHFDTYYGNTDGDNLHNVKSFKVFAKHLKEEVEDLPIIAVGDLNFGPKETDKTTDVPNYLELTSYWTDVYDKVKADGNMTDYYKTYDGTQSGSQHDYYYPFIQFTKNWPSRRLDHIVYKNGASQGVTPTSYRTVRRTYEAEDENTWCPSDHLAVVAYMTFD
jgi:endonuclease/exonuclease/phosphatase family metal-dependent hydrolase